MGKTVNWLRKHVLASIGVVVLALPWIKAVVGLGGDIDFLVSRSQDPGWVSAVWNYIVTASWLPIALTLGGLALIYWDVRRNRYREAAALVAPDLPKPLPNSKGQPPQVAAPPLRASTLPEARPSANITPSVPTKLAAVAALPASASPDGTGPVFVSHAVATRMIRESDLGRSRLAPTQKIMTGWEMSISKALGQIDPVEQENRRQFAYWSRMTLEIFESDEKEAIREGENGKEYDQAVLQSWLGFIFENEVTKKFPLPR